MLTLECAKCGERIMIAPTNPKVANQLQDLEIYCDVCSHSGKPKFVVSNCKGERSI